MVVYQLLKKLYSSYIDETNATNSLFESGLAGNEFPPTEPLLTCKDDTMNRKTLSTLTLALAALASGNVMAQNVAPVDAMAQLQQAHPSSFAAKTTNQLSREAVQADLREARRTGEVVANAEAGIPANEMHPGQYPTQVAEQTMSREEVRADLREALRTGDTVANGETGMKLNEVFPGRYAHKS